MPQRALALLALLVCATAFAQPRPGSLMPTVTVQDVARDAPRQLPDDHPVLVIYEDRAAQTQNQHARAVLGRINNRSDNRARVELVAVADVAKWDFWPARRYVLDELKKIANREKTPLFADWKGALRTAWHLPRQKSVLLLLGSDSKVRFFAQGPLSAAQLEQLTDELKALGCRVD